MKKYRSAVVAALVSAGMSAQATEFQSIGFESISMGGAGVANARGALAAYYNPALLAQRRFDTEMAFGAGAGYREYNLADNIDTLSDLDLSGALDRIAANATPLGTGGNSAADRNAIASAQGILRGMGGGRNGASVMPQAQFGVQAGEYALGVFLSGEVAATAAIDPSRLNLIVAGTGALAGRYFEYDPGSDTYFETTAANYQANSLEYAIDSGLTHMRVQGLLVYELPLSYGLKLSDNLGVGASLKYLRGTTYNSRLQIDTATGDVDSQIEGGEKTSSDFGFDLGVLYSPLPNLRLGLVGKNLNGPKFETAVPSENFKLSPMARAGANVSLGESFDVALDIDLTKNNTFLDDIESRYVGGGFNWHPASWFSLRLGAMSNLAHDNEGIVYTAGLGFGLKWFQFDLAAQQASKESTYNGESIPRYGRVSAAIVSRW